MTNEHFKKIALVRGDCLNEWEALLWNNLGDDFRVTAFCSKKNLYTVKNVDFPIKRLWSSTDNFLLHHFLKYTEGQFIKMFNLEKELEIFDIAHAVETSYFYTYQAVQAKKNNKNLRVVVSVSDNSFGRFEYNYWPFFKSPPTYWRNKMNYIIKTIVNQADYFLPISEYSAELLKYQGVPLNKMTVLPSGIYHKDEQSHVDTSIIPELQRQIDGKELYLMVNRLVVEKGIYDLVYAWHLFLKKTGYGNKKLLVIGKGPQELNIKRLVKDLGLQEYVYFAKNIPNQEVRKLYCKAKVLLLGSMPTSVWQEQFGYVLAEAISNNCPVIASSSGAIPEVVDFAGVLVPSGNPVSFCDALFSFQNKDFYEKIKENCNIVKKKFEIESFQDKLKGVYSHVMENVPS